MFIKSLPDIIKELQAVRLATLLKRHPGSGQKERPEVLCKKSLLRNFTKFTGRHLCQSLFFNNLPGARLNLYLKRDYGTCFFLWILQNFYEHLFHRSPVDDCLCLVFQNQPFVDLLQTLCSWIIQKTQRKTLMLELPF